MDKAFGTMARPSGEVAMAVTRDLGELRYRKAPLGWRVRNFFTNRLREVPSLAVSRLLGRVTGLVRIESRLSLRLVSADGRITDFGTVSRRVVTTVGAGFIVDAFQNLVELENMKYHGFGTGTNAESSGDTALQTELTTEYATNNTRPTGTTTEGASANIYRTVATLSPDANVAITEHGVFDQAANSGGTLLDRSKFSVINLVGSVDSLQATYELTIVAGS